MKTITILTVKNSSHELSFSFNSDVEAFNVARALLGATASPVRQRIDHRLPALYRQVWVEDENFHVVLRHDYEPNLRTIEQYEEDRALAEPKVLPIGPPVAADVPF